MVDFVTSDALSDEDGYKRAGCFNARTQFLLLSEISLALLEKYVKLTLLLCECALLPFREHTQINMAPSPTFFMLLPSKFLLRLPDN